jgi:hypothetical protein
MLTDRVTNTGHIGIIRENITFKKITLEKRKKQKNYIIDELINETKKSTRVRKNGR